MTVLVNGKVVVVILALLKVSTVGVAVGVGVAVSMGTKLGMTEYTGVGVYTFQLMLVVGDTDGTQAYGLPDAEEH